MHIFIKRKMIFRWVFVLWAILIISVSSIPHLSVPKVAIGFRLDYLVHFGMYFVLGFFLVLWRTDKKRFFSLNQNRVFISLCYLFAIVDETHQLWISGRTFAWQDMLSNMLGLTIALGFVPYLYKRCCVD